MTGIHGPGKSSRGPTPATAPHSEQTLYERALGYTRGELLSAAESIQTRLAPHGEDATLTLSLFSKLCVESPAAHTLFGTKPLSEHFLYRGQPEDITIRERWVSPDELEAWKRLESNSGLTSTIFSLRESSTELPHGMGSVLLLYSTHNVREVFATHGDRFREKLGQETTADTIISLLNSAPDFNSLFSNDHELKGLIVGYGAQSARSYARLVELATLGDLGPISSAEKMKERFYSAQLDPSFPANEYLQLIDDIQGHKRETSSFRNSVHFRPHRDDRESEALLTRYDETSKALLTLCVDEGRDVLAKIALARWSGLLP